MKLCKILSKESTRTKKAKQVSLPPSRTERLGRSAPGRLKSGIPTRCIDLSSTVVRAGRNDAFRDIEGVNQIFPSVEIEMENCLVFLKALCLDFLGTSWRRGIYGL